MKHLKLFEEFTKRMSAKDYILSKFSKTVSEKIDYEFVDKLLTVEKKYPDLLFIIVMICSECDPDNYETYLYYLEHGKIREVEDAEWYKEIADLDIDEVATNPETQFYYVVAALEDQKYVNTEDIEKEIGDTDGYENVKDVVDLNDHFIVYGK